MLANLPYWHKLWNKGVDIGAGVAVSTLSAGIIALIATLTWRWKRRRDLQHDAAKQRQQHTITEEFARERASNDNRVRVAILRQEREALAEKFSRAESSGDAEQLQNAWDSWCAWLGANNLEYLPTNCKILDDWAQLKGKFHLANSNQTVSQWANKIMAQVKETQIEH